MIARANLYSKFGKRLLDLIAGVVLLAIFLPVICCTAIAVLINLGSPVLFKQQRPGRNERLFTLYKFRTMCKRVGRDGHVLSDAERLGRFGIWLRATSLDELPALLNVIKGDMSLVGPRPLLAQYLTRYTPEQKKRHKVRPGITGLAQVSGRNAISWDEKLALDCKYVRSMSFGSDLAILFKTVWKVIRRDGITATGTATTTEFLGRSEAKKPGETAAEAGSLTTRWAEAWPVYDREELDKVSEVLASGRVNYWTGEHGRKFEADYAAYLGVEHAVAVMNGTVALELALAAVGVGPGDEVIVPSRTFIATASAVVAQGAIPVVADIDASSQNLTVSTVKAVLTDRTKAIVAVHLGGWPCEMDEIMHLAEAKGFAVVEDCAQAHGAVYRGRPVGSIGHISAFSFCQDKIISTGGEGGLVATNNDDLWERVWSRKDHGKNRLRTNGVGAPGQFRFVHDEFGTNARMTEMQAAIGRVQLGRLAKWKRLRSDGATMLMNELDGFLGLTFPRCPSHSEHAFYRLYGFLDTDNLAVGWNRDRILGELVGMGVPVGCGSCGEIWRERAFRRFAGQPRVPVAKKLHETSLAFAVHPTLSADSLGRIVTAVKDVLSAAYQRKYDRKAA